MTLPTFVYMYKLLKTD